MITIGKKKTGEEIGFSASRARAILVCGKRGSGKSYTLGVLAEEVFAQGNSVVILVDPMGIYWTMAVSGEIKAAEAKLWSVKAGKLPVKILMPGEPVSHFGGRVVEKMRSLGIAFQRFSLNASEISPDGWCAFYEYSVNEPSGIVLYRAVGELAKGGDFFTIEQIAERIKEDAKAQDKTKEALLNRLAMTKDLGLFSDKYQNTSSFFDSKYINIIDISMLYLSAYGLRNLIVGSILRSLFRRAALDRRFEDLGLQSSEERIWLFMDEAHQFIPSGKRTLSKDIITSWVKEGRQPGLSSVFTSQQPSALDNDILSQCDLMIIHRVTNMEDVQALNKLRQEYMVADLKDFLMAVKGPGDALLLDDESERIAVMKVRPRMTKHGGTERRVFNK